MNLRRLLLSLCVGTLVLGPAQSGPAQPKPPRDELLALVPADPGFCLIVQNLREQTEKWKTRPWVKTLRASPLGKSIENAPEWQRLARLEEELTKRFKLTWASLRDDILGDAVVLAYWPAPPGKPEQEQGLLLVRARDARLLAQFMDALNDDQTKSKELKELTVKEHLGVKYQRRVDQRSEHFVLVDGKVLAFTGKEGLMKKLIEAKLQKKPGPLVQQVSRAGIEQAWGVLWVNPRAFEPELQQRQKAGPDALFLKAFLEYWRPIDAMVLSLGESDDLELRLSIQARVKDLPPLFRRTFVEAPRPGELWKRLPPGAVLNLAGSIDVGQLAEFLGAFMPEADRKTTLDSLQSTVMAVSKLDLMKDVLPNIGPDWGISVAAASDPKQFPHILAALAIKPGSGPAPVDRSLVDGINLFATFSTLGKMNVKKAMQDKVEVNYLESDSVFAAGLKPAWALKDGYFILASSPDAVQRFRLQSAPAQIRDGESPFLKISATELSRLVRSHRALVIDYLAKKNKLDAPSVSQSLDSTLMVLDLVDHVTFSQSSGNGQITWTMRVKPRVP